MSEFKEELAAGTLTEDGLKLKDQAFLNVLFEECAGDVRLAMKTVGLNETQLSVTKRLSSQIKALTQEYLAASTARAAIGLVSILTDPTAPGNKVLVTAAKEVLDRGGVYKEEKITITDEQNMFILPSKDPD